MSFGPFGPRPIGALNNITSAPMCSAPAAALPDADDPVAVRFYLTHGYVKGSYRPYRFEDGPLGHTAPAGVDPTSFDRAKECKRQGDRRAGYRYVDPQVKAKYNRDYRLRNQCLLASRRSYGEHVRRSLNRPFCQKCYCNYCVCDE